MNDVTDKIPKAIEKLLKPPLSLPPIENEEESDSLLGEGLKNIIPISIIDNYSRLEVSLVIKLSGNTETLSEASNLKDKLYKRGEIQNKHQYRNVLDKFYSN